MKKIISVGCILTIFLFCFFPASSIAKGSKRGKDSQMPLVCPNEGNIYGLEFDFGKGFPLELLPGLQITITHVEVQASGQEVTVVIPPEEFIYNADLSGGWHSEDGSDEWDSDQGSNGWNSEHGSHGWDSERGKILATATVDLGKKHGKVKDVTLEFEFDFATLSERFDIKKKELPEDCFDLLDVTVPGKMNLYFQVTNAQYVEPAWLINPSGVPPLNLALVIDKGKLVPGSDFRVS